MTLKECYEILGADLDGALKRLSNEKLVERFALKFLNDTSFEELEKALGDKNYEEAFRAAHTLKGVAANLSFSRLHDVSAEFTEMLRGGNAPADEAYMEVVRAEYTRTVEALKQLQGA